MPVQNLKRPGSSKRGLVTAFLVCLLVAVVTVVIYREFHFATSLEIEGTVVDIQWGSANHQLPKFVILDDAGKENEISQFTIALNPSTIKIGDKVVKKEGDAFCLINGRKIRFSSY